MNSTIDHLDRRTHLKIVAVAVLAAAMVLAVGKTAHLGPSSSARLPSQAPAQVTLPAQPKAAPVLLARSARPA